MWCVKKMRARLINTKSFYLGLKECILPKLFLFPYSLLKLESFLRSSTNLISTYSSKTILVSDNENLVETFRSNIYQNEIIKIYNQNKINQKQLIATTNYRKGTENLRKSTYHEMVKFRSLTCTFNHREVSCDKCDCLVHIYCNNIC